MRTVSSTRAVRRLTYLALFTALVVVLQVLTTILNLNGITLPITLALPPIILGAAFCGPLAGAWLGFVMGITVLFQPSTLVFLTFSPFGAVLTVLLKSTMAGLVAGLLFRLLNRCNRYLAVAVAGVVTPVVNTGLFLAGCGIFFMELLREWAAASESLASYIFLSLVGVNFLVELVVNLVLCPVVVRLLSLNRRGTHEG